MKKPAKKQVFNYPVTAESKEPDQDLKNYQEIKQWRNQQIKLVSANHRQLNLLHDEVLRLTIQMAMEKVKGERGNTPAPFAFFLMGSAGRFEQSVWSDQDHGIIFDGSEDSQAYFLALGTEIMDGLTEAGYELCDGKVMASNPLWCRSIDQWERQISSWLEEASWQSLRHFSTFFDSRVLVGEEDYLHQIKETAFSTLESHPFLHKRLLENVGFVKKGIGFFGQLLPEQHGEQTGSVQLKPTTFFPYINALRLLALKEKITAPSTLARFDRLPASYASIKQFEPDFDRLLQFRLASRKNATSYQEVHVIPLDSLTRQEKHELKQLMKKGYNLFDKTKKLIEKECSS